MSISRGERAEPAGPASPCTGVCALDETGLCRGCLRSGEEIGRWLAMSAAEQWQLIAVLEERRRMRAQAGAPGAGSIER